MSTIQSQRFVSQESEGVGGNVSPSVTYFMPEGANLRTQINPTGDDLALSLTIGYRGSLYLHGTLHDLRRLSRLIETTLDEWEGK